jgi:hypothetical protein
VATVAFNIPALVSSPSLKNSNDNEQNGVLQLQSETLGQDGTQSAEELASNTPPAEESSTHIMLDEFNYEPYNISDFGAPNKLLSFISTPAAVATSTSSIMTNHVLASISESHATHKDLGSGFPQGLQAFHSTPQFSSSCSGFNMLVKPKHNPWDRK